MIKGLKRIRKKPGGPMVQGEKGGKEKQWCLEKHTALVGGPEVLTSLRGESTEAWGKSCPVGQFHSGVTDRGKERDRARAFKRRGGSDNSRIEDSGQGKKKPVWEKREGGEKK